MIIDAFIFYNEIKLLEYRLKCLWDKVDKFVIVESTHTFSGTPKESNFEKNIELFKPYISKIIYRLHQSPVDANAWVNEISQRNYILTVLDTLNLDPNDLVILSDVDEIPNMESILSANIATFSCLVQIIYTYNIYQRTPDPWYKPVIIRWFIRQQIQCLHRIRLIPMTNPIYNGGWHLSYFGNVDFIKNKIKSFAHQELNNQKIFDNLAPSIEKCESFVSGQKYARVEWDPKNYPHIQGITEDENRKLLEDLSM